MNGDAEDTSLSPFVYPWSKKQGSSHLKLAFEDNGRGGINHFYSLTNRQYGWASLSHKLLPSCIETDSVYKLSVDLRVHSTEKKSFQFHLTATQPDGSKSWPRLGACQPQDINDGWVTCTSTFQFNELQATASDLKLYLVSNDSSTDDLDVDNFSMTFQSGPIKALVVPDPSGDIASCWGSGSDLLVTSNNLDFDDVQTPTIASVTANSDQTATINLVEPVEMTSYADAEVDFAVEVALLSRNIVFESADSGLAAGGHLMVYHTDIAQSLDGVELRRFGQQGNMGRYVRISEENWLVVGNRAAFLTYFASLIFALTVACTLQHVRGIGGIKSVKKRCAPIQSALLCGSRHTRYHF